MGTSRAALPAFHQVLWHHHLSWLDPQPEVPARKMTFLQCVLVLVHSCIVCSGVAELFYMYGFSLVLSESFVLTCNTSLARMSAQPRLVLNSETLV
jgi:hypothetical protein